MLHLYTLSFAIKKPCERQLKAFDKSVRSAPNDFLLPVPDLPFFKH